MCRTYGGWIIQGMYTQGLRPGLGMFCAYGADAKYAMPMIHGFEL